LAAVLDEFKPTILATWKTYNISPDKGWALRRKCQKDGFFLSTILQYPDFVKTTHQEVFDFFVQKDPDAKDFKTFAESVPGNHDDLLMLCRGGFKSTADIVDTIQWIICFPDVRINIMTGTQPLAIEFIDLIKDHFKTNKDGSPQLGFDGKPRLFQVLFPEFCEKDPGRGTDWTTPARRKAVAGPTIVATAVDMNTTGTHCDILKIDDGTTNANTHTPDRIVTVNKNITAARRLVEPFGFKLRIGTPYAEKDNLYATVLDEEKRAKQGKASLVKCLIRPAYSLAPGYEDKMPDEITPEMVNAGICKLWFPERITLDYLQREYADSLKSDPKSFFSQYLLDLKKANIAKFNREKMVLATVPWDQIPKLIRRGTGQGEIFQAWDLAYGSAESNSDFSVGITGLFILGRVFILDRVRDRFNEDEIAPAIASFAHKWRPARIAVEDTHGTRWLKNPINISMNSLGFNTFVEFVSVSRGVKSNGKVERAKPVVYLLNVGRLLFSLEIPDINQLYDEMEEFPPKSSGKDDTVDALSMLINHFASSELYETTEVPRISSSPKEPQFEDDYNPGLYSHFFDKPVEVVPQGPVILRDTDLEDLMGN